MLSIKKTTKTCKEQYKEFSQNRQVEEAILLPFYGVEKCDIYNPSKPFELDGITWIAGRIEDRGGHNSTVRFFEKKEDGYYCRYDMPEFVMEDPFITFINNELILGGVEVDWEGTKVVGYKTVFYRGTDLNQMERFATGPSVMKDIRLVQLKDKRIGIFTRPRDLSKLEEWGSYAKIGFTIIDDLSQLNGEIITAAPHLEGQFIGQEWGGVNDAILLENGLIGVVGHRSYGTFVSMEEMELHYYGIAFAVDPNTGRTTETKMIISRDCFPVAPPKKEGLEDVTFTSGLVRLGGGKARVYTGLSDSAIGTAIIPDPFMEWEQIKL